MLFNEDSVAGSQQTGEGGLVQILQHPLLLLLQPPLRLLHVLGYRVLSEELDQLPDVEPLGVLQELIFKTIFVDRQVLSPRRGILLVKTELHVAVLD